MEHPIRTSTDTAGRRWRSPVALGLVLLIEGAFAVVLTSGLAMRVVPQLPHALVADVLKPEPQKPAPPPAQPQFVAPQTAAVPPPEIHIAIPRRTAAITTVTTTHPVAVATPQPARIAAPPAPPPTAAVGIASTHTTPPYPELARRLGQQGAVVLHISVSLEGAIEDVAVARSSGSTYLDSAAVAWVRTHWRYRPATHDGKPVASQTDARIVFDLRSAR